MSGCDTVRCNAFEIKQGKAEWRRQERRLDIQADHHTKPYRRDVRGRIGEQDRCHDRHNNDRDFDEIEDEEIASLEKDLDDELAVCEILARGQ